MNKEINFAVGPVMADEQTLTVASEQIPYFRTEEFSSVVKQCEKNIKNLVDANNDSRVVFMTGSGTASMEAAAINVLMEKDRVIIINGGSFGERFCKICDIHRIKYEQIVCESGKTLTKRQLYELDGTKYTALMVNLCETSTGVLYDIDLICEYCKKYNLLLIVDAVSAFLCDKFSMRRHCIDVVITGSQKALGLAPGLSIMCFSARAIERIQKNNIRSLYFDLQLYLSDGLRGQTPFTPAVGIILQLYEKTNRIIASGGVGVALEITKQRAEYFKERIVDLPLNIFADKTSNAVTALLVQEDVNAYDVFLKLYNEYGVYVCPNGGLLREKVFRVGNMGNLNFSDYDFLISGLRNVLQNKKI